MADFISKSFTGANGTGLPTLDASWVRTNTGVWAGTPQVQSNRAYSPVSGQYSGVYNNATPPGADYDVSAQIYRDAGTDGNIQLLGRWNHATSSGYMAGYLAYGWLGIHKVDGGYDTALVAAVEAPGVSAGSTFKLTFRLNGSTLSLHINDSPTAALSVTDTSFTAAGVAGLQTASAPAGLGGVVSFTAGTIPAAVAPVLTSPTGSSTGSTTASGTVSTDKSGGTLYFLASTNASESVATVKASGGSQAVTATGVQNVTRTGLTPSTPYRIHYVHSHADGDSAVASSAAFYTQDVAGTRDTPVLLGGAPQVFDLGGTATPGAVTITVPTDAEFVMIEVDIAGYPSPNDIAASNPITTNFTGTPTLTKQAQTATAMGRATYIAPVTSTGAGKTITVAYAGANGFAPVAMAVFFLDKVDPLYPLRRPPAYASSADGSAAATANSTSAAGDLVLVNDSRGDNDSVFPALGSGFTDLGTFRTAVGGLGYALSHRFKSVTTPPTGAVSATTQNTMISAISVTALRGSLVGSDTTPPTLTSPVGTNTGTTTATGTVSTDEANGTVYAVVSTSSTAPSVAQIQAGQTNAGTSAPWSGNQGVSTTGTKTFNASGLTAGTAYYFHFQHKDSAGNDSTVSTSAVFTTDPPPDTTPPTLTSPSASVTGTTTATGQVTTNEGNGTLYGVVTTSATAPTAAQVIAGQNHLGAAAAWAGGLVISSTGAKTLSATGLAAATSYYFHFQHRDAANNDSAVVTSAQFTTAASDTTAPTLSAASGTQTGGTTATLQVTTDEANGTLFVVVTEYPNDGAPSATQVKNGVDFWDSTPAYAANQAVSSTGAQTFNATGLSVGVQYIAYFVHRDAAGNDSAVSASATWTQPTPDTTPPTLSAGTSAAKSNALVTLGATTNEANGTMYAVLTTSATPPSAAQVMAGQNNTGAAAVWSGNQAIGSTGAKTFNATGLTQLTGYYPYLMHRDAAGNNSAVLSLGLVTTFRNGATGQYIRDNTGPVGGNPAGILYNDVVLPGDADKWFAWRYGTPPSNPGALTINADGSFVYTGTLADSFTYQLEVDGVDVGSPVLVTLDANVGTATPVDSSSPSTSSAASAIQTHVTTAAASRSASTTTAANATQTHQSTAANSRSASTTTASIAGQDNAAAAANSVSPSTSSASATTQDAIATPASSNSPSTSTASSAAMASIATPAGSSSPSTSSTSTALQTNLAVPADSDGPSISERPHVTQTHLITAADSAGPSTSAASRAFNFNLERDIDFCEYAFDDDDIAYYQG